MTTEDPLTSFSVSTVLTFFLFTLYMFDSSSWLQNLCVTKESSTRLTKSDKVKLQRLMAGVLRNTETQIVGADELTALLPSSSPIRLMTQPQKQTVCFTLQQVHVCFLIQGTKESLTAQHTE